LCEKPKEGNEGKKKSKKYMSNNNNTMSEFDTNGCFTQKESTKGRGAKIQGPPVKAQARGILV